MNTLQVGLVGAGWVTQHHLAAWAKQPDAKIVAICDPDLDAAKKRAAEFGISQVYSNAEQMLECERLDAVDIASPRHTHAGIVRQVMQRGLHILCQKPIAPTLAEAEQLASDVHGKARLMVHENWRFRPYYRQIKEWLDAGEIGQPRQCLMSLLSSGMLLNEAGERPMLVRQPFMQTLERMLVTEVLIHHLDTLRFLLGDLVVQDAVLGAVTPGLVGEDMATVTLQSRNKQRVILIGNAAAAGFPASFIDELSIIGDAGTILLRGHTLQLAGNDSKTLEYDLNAGYQESYASAIRHFLDCLQTGTSFETGVEDNLQTMKIVEDIYTMAANNGSWPSR